MNGSGPKKIPSKGGGKEFLIGLLSLVVGGYNILANTGILKLGFDIPSIVTNIVLVLAGLFLIIVSYKLFRYKYHASRIF